MDIRMKAIRIGLALVASPVLACSGSHERGGSTNEFELRALSYNTGLAPDFEISGKLPLDYRLLLDHYALRVEVRGQ